MPTLSIWSVCGMRHSLQSVSFSVLILTIVWLPLH